MMIYMYAYYIVTTWSEQPRDSRIQFEPRARLGVDTYYMYIPNISTIQQLTCAYRQMFFLFLFMRCKA